jgi:hypothetical protein
MILIILIFFKIDPSNLNLFPIKVLQLWKHPFCLEGTRRVGRLGVWFGSRWIFLPHYYLLSKLKINLLIY